MIKKIQKKKGKYSILKFVSDSYIELHRSEGNSTFQIKALSIKKYQLNPKQTKLSRVEIKEREKQRYRENQLKFNWFYEKNQ